MVERLRPFERLRFLRSENGGKNEPIRVRALSVSLPRLPLSKSTREIDHKEDLSLNMLFTPKGSLRTVSSAKPLIRPDSLRSNGQE